MSKDRFVDKQHYDDNYSRDDFSDDLTDVNQPVSRRYSVYKIDQQRGSGYYSQHAGDSIDRIIPPAIDVNSAISGPFLIYELNHLATFTVSTKKQLIKPVDGVKRLREMEATTGVWTMRVQLRLNRREIVITEKATRKEVECFPISRVSNPCCIVDHSAEDLYNNILLFTVQADYGSQQPPEMHLFQCIRKSAQDIAEDIEAAINGRFPRHPPPVKEKPFVNPRPRSPVLSVIDDDKLPFNDVPQHPMYSYRPPQDKSPYRHIGNQPSREISDEDILLLNHCFDDIEGFVASLQQAANALKELERRRMMNGGGHDPAEEMLRMRAKPPPLEQFVDTLQKFKLAINLLPKLQPMLKNPDAIQLLHMLFSPLFLVINSSSGEHKDPTVASKVESPLLTADACHMLETHLNPQETELWRSLGAAWTTPSNVWNGIVPFYYPTFSDGWRHNGANMEDIGMALPPAGYDAGPTQNSRLPYRHITNAPSIGQYGQQIPASWSDPIQHPVVQQHPQQQLQQPQQQPQLPQEPQQLVHSPSQPSLQSQQSVTSLPIPIDINPSQQTYLNELRSKGARIYVVMVGRDGKKSERAFSQNRRCAGVTGRQ
jgi:epidermal growth factor receptor kinase substrate 8